MTYSEDYPSFAGDQTGQLLAEPDLVALSPVTSARVVETQSGYLVVLKKADERLSLSVKRRIGTPPSSQVLLTPDESIQLSRVLTDSVDTLGAVRGDYLIRNPAQELPPLETPSSIDRELSTIYGGTDDDEPEAQLDWDEIKQPWRKRRAKQSSQEVENVSSEPAAREPRKKFDLNFNLKPILFTAGGIAAVAVVIGLGVFASSAFNGLIKSEPGTKTAKTAAVDPMGADNVDKFVRNFVANMLDFNPRTYRASQVHAMAAMQPELLERYWQETAFPLPKSKLKALHKDQTLIINKVVQQPTSAVSTDVEMSADLVTPGQTGSTTVRLQIDLGLDQDGGLVVLDLKDSSPKDQ